MNFISGNVFASLSTYHYYIVEKVERFRDIAATAATNAFKCLNHEHSDPTSKSPTHLRCLDKWFQQPTECVHFHHHIKESNQEPIPAHVYVSPLAFQETPTRCAYYLKSDQSIGQPSKGGVEERPKIDNDRCQISRHTFFSPWTMTTFTNPNVSFQATIRTACQVPEVLAKREDDQSSVRTNQVKVKVSRKHVEKCSVQKKILT